MVLVGCMRVTVPRGLLEILIILQTSYVSGSKALKLTDSVCSVFESFNSDSALIHFTPELSLATETQRDAGDFVPL